LPGISLSIQNLPCLWLLYGVKNLTERMEALLKHFDLEKFETPSADCFFGEQTRVSLAKAMLNQPHLLLWMNRLRRWIRRPRARFVP